ncbi:NADH-quinone oxidoreductase subunit NuoN [Trueperella sp. LYQ143]|uniref:NADH-quinone oxidoreductase subunit NuoN n=1 Tax=unclassified Trueperella TaxID=2630174 RepID=UPI003982FC13
MNVQISWLAILPILVVLGAAVAGTLVEAFLPYRVRRGVQVTLSLLALAVALVAIVWRWTEMQTGNTMTPLAFHESQTGMVYPFAEDAISLISQSIIVGCALLAFLVIADRTQTREGAFAASAATRPGSSAEREMTRAGRQQTEIFPLALFATGGMMAFVSSFNLLSLFIALEVISLPLYVLCATARRKRLLSQEAALKYFVLGAFSSAIFLMGSAFIYGSTGSLDFAVIFTYEYRAGLSTALLTMGVIMLVIGLLFKVGAAPFHAWTPDVYQGAPTPITGFMAAGTKTAAFVVLGRVFLLLVGHAYSTISIFMWIVIIATIVIGTFAGLAQTDVKRMLAYSSIAHAGFILIAINAISWTGSAHPGKALAAVLFYLLAYGVATVGAFGVVTLVKERDAAGNILGEATKLASWAGLGQRSPMLAAAMTIFLLSFAGIPFTGGFIGKFQVFVTGLDAHMVPLVIVAVLASVVTGVFYFRLIQLMFFRAPQAQSVAVVESEGMSVVAIVLAVIGTIALGVFPGPVFDFILGSFV